MRNYFGSGKGQMMCFISNKLSFGCNIQMKRERRVVSEERELEYVSGRPEMFDQNQIEGERMFPRWSGRRFFGSIGQQEIQVI